MALSHGSAQRNHHVISRHQRPIDRGTPNNKIEFEQDHIGPSQGLSSVSWNEYAIMVGPAGEYNATAC
jgi:hypothetical protein